MSVSTNQSLPDEHFLFFATTLETQHVLLSQTESHHACAVLRKNNGDEIYCTDGRGTIARGIISHCSPHSAEVQIISRSRPQRPSPESWLLIGLPERDAFESLLPNAVALGVSTIIPVIADYCQKPWWSHSWEKCTARFHTKMITALKQSRNLWLPHLQTPGRLSELLTEKIPQTRFLTDQEGEPAGTLLSHHISDQPLTVAVGPPGGFSKKEKELLTGKNFLQIKIASFRLRTELAVTTVLAQITGYST